MNLIYWNAWGLGSPDAFPQLRKIIRNHSLGLLFLIETRLQEAMAKDFHIRLGFSSSFSVECGEEWGSVVSLGQQLGCRN